MALFYSEANPRLKEEFSELQQTPGYCIVVDVVDSVALKCKQDLEVWCAAMHNVFAKSKWWLDDFGPDDIRKDVNSLELQQVGLLPLKIIGDCVMFFIPLRSMPKGATALSVFCSLQGIIEQVVCHKPEVRIAVSFCEDCYEITFVKGMNDIYGADIDLTYRLLKKANPQELVMDERFYLRARCIYSKLVNQNEYRTFADVHGPWPEILKGFQESKNIYKWCSRFKSTNLQK